MIDKTDYEMTTKERRQVILDNLGKDREFNMGKFFNVLNQFSIVKNILRTGEIDKDSCGTACCIAGEIAIRFPKEMKRVTDEFIKSGKFYIDDYGDISERLSGSSCIIPFASVAAEIIGVNPSVFFVPYWPADLEKAYEDDPLNRIELAKKVINEQIIKD